MTVVAGQYGMYEEVPAKAEAGQVARIHITTTHWHPTFREFLLVLLHLRPVEGAAPPVVTVAGANYAIGCVTLCPDHIVDFEQGVHYLSPANFEVQFEASEERGRYLLYRCADLIVEGEATPEAGQNIAGVTEEWQYRVNRMLEEV